MLHVIIPACNAEKFIIQSVESVLRQPEVDRLTVVDDASTDGTVAALLPVLHEFKARMEVVRLKENGGQYRAINTAVDLGRVWAVETRRHDIADGPEFIAIHDADDVCEPDRFARSLARLQAEDKPDVVSGRMYQTDAELNRNGVVCGIDYPTDPGTVLERRYATCMILGVTTMRRSAFQLLGGFEPSRGGADTQFFCRAFFAGLKLVNLPDVLGSYRQHPGQCTHDMHHDPVRSAYRKKNQSEWLFWKEMRKAGKLQPWHLQAANVKVGYDDVEPVR